MTEFKIGKAIVRIHGKPDQERIKAATTIFLKKVEAAKRKAKKNNT
jgi:hypothetical protein